MASHFCSWASAAASARQTGARSTVSATRDDVLSVLKAHEAELRAQGVARVAVFGSLARGDARPDSDVDLMVEIDPEARLDLWSYTGAVLFLQDLFQIRVDVANHDTLKPHVRP